MQKHFTKHHVLLHAIVFVWGFAPILGRGITASALQLVWFRIAITIVCLGLYLVYTKQTPRISFKKIGQLAIVGSIICIHWLCFYQAIKVSNVSVTMAAFSTGTLFTALIEPLVYKRKIIWYELFIGLIIIAAICLIFSVEIKFGYGILLGILAAFTASLFSVYNSVFIKNEQEPITSSVLCTIELTCALITLSVYLLFTNTFSADFFNISSPDLLLITTLALVCTVYPFIATVNLMKHLSPYTINLTVNLESVYGIILASILFHENKELSVTFYIGFAIILCAIFLNALLKRKYS